MSGGVGRESDIGLLDDWCECWVFHGGVDRVHGYCLIRRVILCLSTDVLEDSAAPIIRVDFCGLKQDIGAIKTKNEIHFWVKVKYRHRFIWRRASYRRWQLPNGRVIFALSTHERIDSFRMCWFTRNYEAAHKTTPLLTDKVTSCEHCVWFKLQVANDNRKEN
jgi:hypothetical protein